MTRVFKFFYHDIHYPTCADCWTLAEIKPTILYKKVDQVILLDHVIKSTLTTIHCKTPQKNSSSSIMSPQTSIYTESLSLRWRPERPIASRYPPNSVSLSSASGVSKALIFNGFYTQLGLSVPHTTIKHQNPSSSNSTCFCASFCIILQ